MRALINMHQVCRHDFFGLFLTFVLSLLMVFQVFQTSSERVESAGLSALSALVSSLSRSVLNSDSEDVLRVFLNLVLKGID